MASSCIDAFLHPYTLAAKIGVPLRDLMYLAFKDSSGLLAFVQKIPGFNADFLRSRLKVIVFLNGVLFIILGKKSVFE